VTQGLITYAGTTVFFWWTMHFLLAGQLAWSRLIRAAILTALFVLGLELFSSVYFSAAIVSDSRLYGPIGVVFTLLTWFIAIGAVIVLGAVAGATWDQRSGRSRNKHRSIRSGTRRIRPPAAGQDRPAGSATGTDNSVCYSPPGVLNPLRHVGWVDAQRFLRAGSDRLAGIPH
jgi:Virulence factor BrkB